MLEPPITISIREYQKAHVLIMMLTVKRKAVQGLRLRTRKRTRGDFLDLPKVRSPQWQWFENKYILTCVKNSEVEAFNQMSDSPYIP